MKSMLEVAASAATVLGSAGAAALLSDGIVRAAGRLTCFICNLGSGSSLPGTLPGLGGPLGGSPDDEEEEEDDNNCAGEERAVMEWKGRVATWEAQVDFYQKEIQKLERPMKDLLAQLTELAPQAQSDLLRYLADDALGKLRDLLLGQIPIPGTDDFDAGDVFGALTGGDLSGKASAFGTGDEFKDVGVGDVTGFASDMVRYFRLLRDLSTGSFDEIRKIADERRADGEPLAAIDKYFAAMAQLKALTDKGYALSHLVNQKQRELQEHREKLAAAESALDACLARVG